MMPTDRFERQLPELLTELAEPRTPEYLDELLWQTAHTSQRPAWTLLERWFPMDVTMSRVHAPTGARYVALLAIVTLIAAIAFAIAGSQRRVPTPFGPAANGLIAFTTAAGDIVTGDPLTGVTRTIVGGPERDSSPTFSLDGTRVAFVRKVEEMVRVFVVDATGGKPIELTSAPLSGAAWLRWSPDGAHLAWLSEGSLWIAMTDGSDAHRVDLEMTIREEIAWRPPDGSELLVRGLPNGKAAYGLFLVKPDGSELRPVTPLDGGTPNYRSLTWSPDGRRFAYGDKPSPGEYSQQVHVLTIDGLRDVVLKPDDDSGLLFPAWSPDGTRLAFVVKGKGIGVAPADDESPHVTLTEPSSAAPLDYAWSPDSNLILAVPWGTGEPWLMDPAGGPGRRVSWTASDFPRNRGSWSNWQRLTP
jgi:Tol biopolymer transport system component